jgi:cytochrome d ubiquinol oxidase subunit II
VEFRRRAFGAGLAAGGVAVAGIFIVNADNHALFHSLLTGRALPAVIVSATAGATTLALVYRRRFEPARYCAALAVASIIAGWALSRWPTILPGLIVDDAAAGHDVLVAVVVSVLAGAAILFPSLALLFGIAVSGRFRAAARDAPVPAAKHPPRVRVAVLARVSIASLIAGFGLLNVAEAPWAHAVGIVCLFAFVLSGFRAITRAALDRRPAA